MAGSATKLPVKSEEKKVESTSAREWRPFEALRREIDRVFEDFGGGLWRSPSRRSTSDLQPFWGRELTWSATPATDVVETDKGYEITAELPGMSEKDVEVAAANGILTIKGEKKEEKEEKKKEKEEKKKEKEEKKKDYYLSERRYGSFERRLQIPEGVDENKIDASFKNGVLTVSLPKKSEAQKPQKKIDVKAG